MAKMTGFRSSPMSVLVPVVGGPWEGRVVASPPTARFLAVLGRGCVEHYSRRGDDWRYIRSDFTTPRGFVVFT